MAYKVIVSQRCQREIENAFEYYLLYSNTAPSKFLIAIKEAYNLLEKNPFLRIRYNNIRSLKLKNFPYSLYFVINIENNTVRILSCFHDSRNPHNRPK